MKSVLISIKPKWCEMIASGKKTIEVRKTRPKCDTPFKCYIYCTLSELLTRSNYNSKIYVATNKKYQNELERFGNTTLSGKVIGEFVCRNITCIQADIDSQGEKLLYKTAFIKNRMCLTYEELFNYIYDGKINIGWGWGISDLVIYDKPRELRDFRKPCIYGEESDVSCFLCDKSGYRPDMHIDCFNEVTTPPQSWCYVEESKKRADDFCSYAEKKEGD